MLEADPNDRVENTLTIPDVPVETPQPKASEEAASELDLTPPAVADVTDDDDEDVDDIEADDTELESSETLPSYIKKHFRKQERRLKKENRALRTQVQQQEQFIQSTIGEPPEPVSPALVSPETEQPENPTTGVTPADIKQTVQAALVEEREKADFQQQQHDRAKQEAEFAQQLNDASNKYPDFEKTVYAKDAPFTPTMVEATKYFPNAPEFIYALARNKKEVQRISKLSGADQLKAMATHAINFHAAQKNKVSQAPTPMDNQLPRISPRSNDLTNAAYEQVKAHYKNKRRGKNNG